jgi:hypothetical protein
MLIAKAERTDLLHLGVREWDVQNVDAFPPVATDDCVLVWHHKLHTMPDVVVVADGGVQGFLAWTTTYIPHLTPITALVEVTEHRSFTARVAGHQTDRPINAAMKSAAFMRGCLGLLHAEVVAGFQGSFAPLYAGLTPYVSTFSWLAFQQQTASSTGARLSTLRENWDEARRLLDARRLGYRSEDVEEVWSLITEPDVGGGAKQNRQVRQITAFLDSVQTGRHSPETLDTAKEQSDVLDVLQSGPLESRVEIFRKLVQSLYGKREPPAAHALILGFALSLISQGSFSHVGLLGPLRISDVRPLLWYGWFDFYRHTPEAAAPAVAGASLQLLRVLKNSRSGCLRRDIAIDELRVLSRQKDPFAECLLDTRHPVGVEIVTGAVSLIQPGQLRGSDNDRGRYQQRLLFNDPPYGAA